MNVPNEYNNIQRQRERTVLTENQRKQAQTLRQGVLVDNVINSHPILNEVCDSLVISDKVVDQNDIVNQYSTKRPNSKNPLIPLCLSSIGLFGLLSTATYGIKKIADYKVKSDAWLQLPEIARNVNLNNEKHFVTYAAIQNPNVKTALGAAGVFVLASAAFIAKNCVDGFKEIWVKRKEAEIQRNLQEKLIAVETQAFAGKIEINRNLMSENAQLFENALKKRNKNCLPQAFKKLINFCAQKNKPNEVNNKNTDPSKPFTFFLGAFTAAAMTGLTYLSLKNLQKTTKVISKHKDDTLNALNKYIKNSKQFKTEDLSALKANIILLHPNKKEFYDIMEGLKSKLNPAEFKVLKTDIQREVEKLSQTPPSNFAGTPSVKPSYFSYIDDYNGHFYNWLVNFDSPFLAALFCGIAGVSSGSYVGTRAIEAIKEVQVKKMNANIELELQKQLVEVELKNYASKKRAAIAPLVEEFNSKKAAGKDKTELKNMATNILFEIKNGPPYIYS